MRVAFVSRSVSLLVPLIAPLAASAAWLACGPGQTALPGDAGASREAGTVGTSFPDSSAPYPEGGPLGGRTQVTVVPANQSSGGPYMVYVDSTGVYVENVDSQNAYTLSLLRYPPSGGTPTTFATGLDTLDGVTSTATSVYWANEYDLNGAADASSSQRGAVLMAPIGGGTPVALATAQALPVAVAVDATSVYWANLGGGCGTSASCPGSVMSLPLTGGTPATLAQGPWAPVDIAVDAANVYWSTRDGHLMKVSRSGGTTTTLAFYSTSIGSLLVSGTSLYWTTSSGDIMTTPVAGGASTPLFLGTSNIGGLAVDSTSAYFTVDDYTAYPPVGSVQKLPLAGGQPETIWSGPDFPGAIGVDATSVYVQLSQGGVVKLTPK